MNPAQPFQALTERLLHLPRAGKRMLAVLLDAGLCALTVWLAWSLRLDQWVPPGRLHPWAILGAWLLALPVFAHYGLYAAIFRYAGWNAMLAVGKAAATYGALYATVFTIVGVPGIPRSVGIIQPLLMFVALGLSRVSVRLWMGDLYRALHARANAPGVLIYGAGKAGMQLAASLLRMDDQRLVGYLDDNPVLQGRRLDGLPVHAPAQVAELVHRHKVGSVLLAIPSASAQRRKEIMELLRPCEVHVRTLPGMAELVRRGVHPRDLQDLDIEDLLGRDPVRPDAALMAAHLGGKAVLVTGAGGSIGSELCRQILQWQPRVLLLLERSEHALYEIHRELTTLRGDAAAEAPATQIVPLLGSVLDAERIEAILHGWRPDIVYHAAAYKHVPLVEQNPLEGLRNNVWGTLVCAQAAARHGVQRFVLVSTDKAVRPTNVMGASKRLAEMVLQALDEETRRSGASAPCYTMVRFGNVLGSSGSVVPLFRRQIDAGGPVTVTHPEVTRYFMTIPEAAQLVIQAGAMAQGGGVFVLDMGEPVRIHDLARRMIELSGQRVRDAGNPSGIEIRITGLRPGEKLYEELLIGGATEATQHPRIMKAHERYLPWPRLQAQLERMGALMRARRHEELRDLLIELVDGYNPASPVVDWVQQTRTQPIAANERAATSGQVVAFVRRV